MGAEDCGAAWITASDLLHGVAIAIPAAEIPAMLAWCEPFTVPYDQRIGMYWRRILDRRILYTWPSLVDHHDTPSLVQHADGAPRTSVRRARLLGTPEGWDTTPIHAGQPTP